MDHFKKAHEKYASDLKKKKMKPGGGGRFAAMEHAIEKTGKSEESAKAIAAAAGRKKYGNAQMTKWAANGKRRAAKA